MKVKFPRDITPSRYYNIHALYLRKVLEDSGIQLEIVENTAVHSGFTVDIDGTTAYIDFGDHPSIFEKYKQYKVYFKFHYTKQHERLKNVLPFAPVSFNDWKEYRTLRSEINYKCNSNIVLNMQRPFLSALERRRFVQKLLKGKYGEQVETEYGLSQLAYWKKINNCLVHVFIPGARSDILDRGHLQYIGFGCCTIAPLIADILPYYKNLIPGIHYIQIKSDYSDLIDKIEWCKSNREECIEIGNNAQRLFDETCTPSSLKTWIEKYERELERNIQ